MTDTSDAATRRAKRLLRLYPRRWRARYGEEFTQLLIDDMSERPHSVTRAADVARSGLLARVACTGLAGDTLEPVQQIRAGLAAVGCALIAFLTFGVAIWSQLTIGWQWSAPTSPATKTAMLVMSAVILVFAVLAVLAAIPVVCTLCRTFAQGRASGLVAPVIAVVVGAVVLVVGSIHFGNGWPGTGGHPWAGRDVVPIAVARSSWAATLWITSYWAHPGALASFPTSEITWMVASPIALVAVLIGVAKTLRRLPLSPRTLHYESWLGTAAALAMAGFLAGAGSWIISGGPAPRGLFRIGLIDSVGVAVMAAAMILAFRAAQRALTASVIRSSTR
jgi:hypothetical protein